MTHAHVAPLLAVWALAVIAPGPDFVAVLRTSVVRGRAAGITVGVGVVSGIACWAILAMTGLGLLLTRYAEVYAVVRAIGAVFLIAYGARVLWHAWHAGRAEAADGARSSESATVDVPAAGRGHWSAWRLGLATNLANPKAIAFFGALFASILPPGLGVGDRVQVVVAILALALAGFIAPAMTESTGAVSTAYAKGRRVVDSVTGGVLTGIGVALFPR